MHRLESATFIDWLSDLAVLPSADFTVASNAAPLGPFHRNCRIANRSAGFIEVGFNRIKTATRDTNVASRSKPWERGTPAP
jgi:hypothetical protein